MGLKSKIVIHWIAKIKKSYYLSKRKIIIWKTSPKVLSGKTEEIRRGEAKTAKVLRWKEKERLLIGLKTEKGIRVEETKAGIRKTTKQRNRK